MSCLAPKLAQQVARCFVVLAALEGLDDGVGERSGQVIDDMQVPVHRQHIKGLPSEADSCGECSLPRAVAMKVGEGPADRPRQRPAAVRSRGVR